MARKGRHYEIATRARKHYITPNTWIVFFGEGGVIEKVEKFNHTDVEHRIRWLWKKHHATAFVDAQDELEVFSKITQEEGSWFDA